MLENETFHRRNKTFVDRNPNNLYNLSLKSYIFSYNIYTTILT